MLASPVEWPQKRFNQQTNTGKYLFISNYAREKIFQSTSWGQIITHDLIDTHGRRIPQNTIEQGGILLGKVY